MKKIALLFAIVALVSCSGSDDDSPNVELYFTAEGVQRPFYAEAELGEDEDGQEAVLVYADRQNQQVTFDVPVGAEGDYVINHIEYIPDLEEGTAFYPSSDFFSEVTLNADSRIKGNFSGYVSDGETEQYIECEFNVKRIDN